MGGRIQSIAIALVLLVIHEVRSDGYGSGISKNTFSASNPLQCFDFLNKYLPVRCQDDFACNISTPCITTSRVALCNADSMISETGCSMPEGRKGLFGHFFGGPPGGGGGGPPQDDIENNEEKDEENEEFDEDDDPKGSGSWYNFFSGGGPPKGGGPPPGGPGGDFGIHAVK